MCTVIAWSVSVSVTQTQGNNTNTGYGQCVNIMQDYYHKFIFSIQALAWITSLSSHLKLALHSCIDLVGRSILFLTPAWATFLPEDINFLTTLCMPPQEVRVAVCGDGGGAWLYTCNMHAFYTLLLQFYKTKHSASDFKCMYYTTILIGLCCWHTYITLCLKISCVEHVKCIFTYVYSNFHLMQSIGWLK